MASQNDITSPDGELTGTPVAPSSPGGVLVDPGGGETVPSDGLDFIWKGDGVGGWAQSPEAGGGTGDVVGPAGATDNAVALYDGATGKLLKDGPTPGAASGLAELDGSTEVPASQHKVFVGDSGAGGTKGAVPAPAAGDADADKFVSANGTFKVTPGGGAALSLSWKFDTAIADADPGVKKFRYNNATQSSATFIFFDNISQSGLDTSALLLMLKSGDQIVIQEASDATRFQLWNITGDPTDAGGYIKVPVSILDAGVDLRNAKLCGAIFLLTGVGAHTHPASEVDSGTFADARIAESNVTQHEGAIDHDALTNSLIVQHRVINDAGTSTTELWSANKIDSEISTVTSGFDLKAGVDTSTKGVGDITLSGEQPLNGFLTSGSRVLVTDQTLSEDNGIYDTAAGAWSRAPDADGTPSNEVSNGNIVHVVNSGSDKFRDKYLLVTADPITVGTTGQTWEEHKNIDFGTVAGTATEGNDPRVLSQDENDAAAGTSGTPSTTNKYVTNADARNTNARAPTVHASDHTDGTDDIQDATAAQKGLATAAQITKLTAIEAGATADQTDAEIKTAYEANANTNEFSDAEQSKLAAIEAAADVTDAANVAGAGAVMDSDISEAEGFLRKTGAGTYEAIKTNIGATTAPGVSNDNTQGYAVLSRWADTTADKEYVCLDASTGAAVWIETTASASSTPTKELFVPIHNANDTVGKFLVHNVISNGSLNVSFFVPHNFVSLVALELICIPDATASGRDIDISSEYGAVGEAFNANAESDATTTYSFTQDQIKGIDISGVFSSLAANDRCGLFVDHNTIGLTIGYVGLRLRYS